MVLAHGGMLKTLGQWYLMGGVYTQGWKGSILFVRYRLYVYFSPSRSFLSVLRSRRLLWSSLGKNEARAFKQLFLNCPLYHYMCLSITLLGVLSDTLNDFVCLLRLLCYWGCKPDSCICSSCDAHGVSDLHVRADATPNFARWRENAWTFRNMAVVWTRSLHLSTFVVINKYLLQNFKKKIRCGWLVGLVCERRVHVLV